MALVVFLRGVNVGGHRRFRPSALARALPDHDIVNVGATGTFVVRRPGSRAALRAALLRELPFAAEIAICEGRDLVRLELENPFGGEPPRPDVVRFVSIFSRAGRPRAPLPASIPPSGDWFVRVLASSGRFAFGLYRRQMRTIGYLGQLDALFGAPATTRSWSTMIAIIRILKSERKTRR
jgi:hypothetical protein